MKHVAASALSVVWAICLLAPVQADTYYVATSGNDEQPGTAEKPFRTLNRGVKPLKPGDTLVVREGVYRESLRDNIPAGTSWDAPVTIKAAPGEKVVLRPDQVTAVVIDFYLVDGQPQQFIVIDGLVLDAINVLHDCVKLNSPAHHLRFVGCEIKHAANQGILAANEADGCEYLKLLVHDNGIHEGAHGLYLGGRGVRIEGCRIYNNGGNALRNNGLHDSVMAYNTIHHNGRHQVSPAAEFHGTGNLMHHNLLYANRSGITVVVRGSGKISHNTLAGNVGYGIYLSNREAVVHVANNIIVGDTLVGLFNASSAADSVIENNVAFGHPYNFENRANVRTWRNNQEADPRFADAARRDYRLTQSSPARDAAVLLDGLPRDLDGQPRVVGPAPDRGAYEFDKAVKTPARNLPPEVDAGPDLVTTMTNPTVSLAGAVADDGESDEPVALCWKTRIGPAPVVFAAAHSAQTQATFSTPGAYLLQLFADDSAASAADLIAVFVHPELKQKGPIRIEAEHMQLEFHGVKEGTFASGGKYVWKQTAMTTSLYTRLPLPKGHYDVVVGYFDENDGQAKQEFLLARGDVPMNFTTLLRQDWTYDQDLPGTEPSEQTAARKRLGENVPLQPGDTLQITTFRDRDELPTIDYIEFILKDH